jgi:hypothetical protein
VLLVVRLRERLFGIDGKRRAVGVHGLTAEHRRHTFEIKRDLAGDDRVRLERL